MSKNVVIAAIIILVLAVAGWYLLKPQKMSAPQAPSETTSTPIPTQSPTATEGAMMEEGETLVTISSSEFSPKKVTITVGQSVTWVNKDSQDHTVNSNPHPTHTDNPFLNVGLIRPGEKKSLTFDKAGTYKYHDHLNPSLTGSVTVE